MSLNLNPLLPFRNLRDFGLTLSDLQSRSRADLRDLFMPDDALGTSDLAHRDAIAEHIASRP